MNLKTLKVIALLTSFIGTLILFGYTQIQDLEARNIYSINYQDINKDVKITGKIINIKTTNSTTILTLEAQEKIETILFENNEISQSKISNLITNNPPPNPKNNSNHYQNPKYNINDKIQIIGTVKEYKGKYELVSKSIKTLKSKNSTT